MIIGRSRLAVQQYRHSPGSVSGSVSVYDFPFTIYYLSNDVTWYREDSNGISFSVRVVPRASRNEIVGLHDGALRIRVAAPPVEGAANRELVKFLAKKLSLPRTSVTLVSGSNSKNKIIRLLNPKVTTRQQLIDLS